MMRPFLRAASAALLLGALAGLSGCTTTKKWYADTFLAGNVLTYEQYLSMDQDANPPPTVDDVLAKLGTPMDVRDSDGVRRRLDYHAFSLTDDLKIAEFHFDSNERLMKKELW